MTTKPATNDGLNRVWAAGASNPAEIVDPDTILAGKVNSGWAPEFPPFQYMNWLQRYLTQHLTHLNEYGIGQWDAATDYPIGGIAKSTVDGREYISLVTPNVNNEPSASATEWEAYKPGTSTFYIDSAVTDDYELTNVDPRSAPKEYVDGMVFRFIPNTDALSTATLTPNGLPTKSIVDEQGVGLAGGLSGTIIAGRLAECYYDEPNDVIVVRQSYAPPATESLAGISERATNAEAIAGVSTTRTVSPANLAAVLATLDSDDIDNASSVTGTTVSDALQTLEAAIGSQLIQTAYLTADQSTTSDTDVVVTELSTMTLAANTAYTIDMFLIFSSVTDSGVVLSSSSVASSQQLYLYDSVNGDSSPKYNQGSAAISLTLLPANVGLTSRVTYHGFITRGGSSGTLNITFRRQTAAGTLTLAAGSWVRIIRAS